MWCWSCSSGSGQPDDVLWHARTHVHCRHPVNAVCCWDVMCGAGSLLPQWVFASPMGRSCQSLSPPPNNNRRMRKRNRRRGPRHTGTQPPPAPPSAGMRAHCPFYNCSSSSLSGSCCSASYLSCRSRNPHCSCRRLNHSLHSTMKRTHCLSCLCPIRHFPMRCSTWHSTWPNHWICHHRCLCLWPCHRHPCH